jgi:hypothetical protein
MRCRVTVGCKRRGCWRGWIRMRMGVGCSWCVCFSIGHTDTHLTPHSHPRTRNEQACSRSFPIFIKCEKEMKILTRTKIFVAIKNSLN